MKVTVLPLRDSERRDRPAPPQPVPSAPSSAFQGMPPTAVELLHATRKRPAPAPRPPAAPDASNPPGPALSAPSVAAAVEIELPNGRIVRAPPGFASADLERALAIASGTTAHEGTPPEER